MTFSDQDIQALIAEGNDEQVVRLMGTLLDRGRDQGARRTAVLQDLAERYLSLALSHEKGMAGQDIEEALKRLSTGSLVFAPQTERDESALGWYGEALDCLEVALQLAPAEFDKGRAIRLAYLAAYALHGKERLEMLIEMSKSDLIGTDDGVYLTLAGEARFRGARSG